MISQYQRLKSAIYVSNIRTEHGYPARFHKDVELLYVKDGWVDICVDNSNYRLESGDLCLVFPNILHSITAQSCHKILITVDPALISGVWDTLSQQKPACPVLRGSAVPGVVPVLLERCAALWQTEDSLPRIQAHMTGILCEALPLLELIPRCTGTDVQQLLVEYIMAHYTEDVSLAGLSQALGYSQYHISHMISDTFGCNFRTLLNNYRVDAAAEMLRHTRKSISEITYLCGFQTQSAFNRAFRKHCKVTPSQYRAAAKQI